MKLQGAGAEKFAQKPDSGCKCVLIFGDDEGVVADTANHLIKAWRADQPATTITLDEDDIKREPSLLFDALEAQSLLGELAILRVRIKGEKLFSILKDVLAIAQDTPDRIAARLVLQSGSLNTRSKTRTAFEAGANVAALHVFADSDGDIAKMVKSRLSKENIEIADDALAAFVGGLPGHRSLANAELEKLSLYAYDLGRAVTRADIRALCETNADESARAAVALALEGSSTEAQAEIDRVIDAGLSPISLVRMFELEATRMLEAQALGAEGGANVGMKLRPPVWKSEWPAFKTRLQKWPMPRLVRLIERLHDLEAFSKTHGGAADPATRVLFSALYQAASGAARAN